MKEKQLCKDDDDDDDSMKRIIKIIKINISDHEAD